jgi:competence protein CoiA
MKIKQLFTPLQDKKGFPKKAWFQLKDYWRRYTPLTPSSEDIFIRQLICKKDYDIPHLPSEVGLPTPAQFTIKTQSVYWQTWIIIALLHPMKIGSCIKFEKIYKEFELKVDQKIFQVRELPCINESHFSIAIMEYMEILIKLGFLEKIKEQAFIKLKDFQFPKTMKEAVSRDTIVQQKLFF